MTLGTRYGQLFNGSKGPLNGIEMIFDDLYHDLMSYIYISYISYMVVYLEICVCHQILYTWLLIARKQKRKNKHGQSVCFPVWSDKNTLKYLDMLFMSKCVML